MKRQSKQFRTRIPATDPGEVVSVTGAGDTVSQADLLETVRAWEEEKIGR